MIPSVRDKAMGRKEYRQQHCSPSKKRLGFVRSLCISTGSPSTICLSPVIHSPPCETAADLARQHSTIARPAGHTPVHQQNSLSNSTPACDAPRCPGVCCVAANSMENGTNGSSGRVGWSARHRRQAGTAGGAAAQMLAEAPVQSGGRLRWSKATKI